MLNIERYGNTTSGTIPLCLWTTKSNSTKATTSSSPRSAAALPGVGVGKVAAGSGEVVTFPAHSHCFSVSQLNTPYKENLV